MPAARVAALRSAFWATVTSPELKADAERLRLIVNPMNWQDTVAAFRAFLDVPQRIIDRAKVAIRKQK